MNATAQQMTSDQIIDLLDASGIDNYTRDLGCSGGGDWWAIEVPAPRDRFILITDMDAPFNAAADDDATEYVAVCLYDSGDYEDLADCPWTYLGTDEITATPDAILEAVRALVAHAEVWNTTDGSN